MLVSLAASTLDFRRTSTRRCSRRGRDFPAFALFRMLAVLLRGTWTAKPFRVRILAGHSIDPADSPGCACSGRCFLGGLARAGFDRERRLRHPSSAPARSRVLWDCTVQVVREEACSFEVSFSLQCA